MRIMKDFETRGRAMPGVTIALGVMVLLFVGSAFWSVRCWVVMAFKEVGGAFGDLGRDFKSMMKGEG